MGWAIFVQALAASKGLPCVSRWQWLQPVVEGMRRPAALAAALAGYFRDPGRALAHGAAGRRRVEAEFSLDVMVSRYIACYDTLLGRVSVQPAMAGGYQT